MKKNRLKLIVLLFSGLVMNCLQAQEAITVAGGNASGTGGTVSYSAGQVVYTTITGTNGSVAQGIQQAFEISVVSGIGEVSDIALKCTVYPNPAIDYLVLEISETEIRRLSYRLYDIQGKLLENKILVANETSIEMRNFLPSTYFLKVIQENKEVKTFKIIKN